MAKMEKKTFAKPDDKRKFDKGLLELLTLGGVTFGRGTFRAGWRYHQGMTHGWWETSR